MTETHKNGAKRSLKVPEFLREPIEQAQARLVQMEENAQKALKDLVAKGRAGRKDLEAMVQKLSKDERVAELRLRLEKLRVTGSERADEWRDRAEHFRADALERLADLQHKAVNFLGVATRDQVEELSREIDRLAKRFEKRAPKKARKPAKVEA